MKTSLSLGLPAFSSGYLLWCNKPPSKHFIIYVLLVLSPNFGQVQLDDSLVPCCLNWGHLMAFIWHLAWSEGPRWLYFFILGPGRNGWKGGPDWGCPPEHLPVASLTWWLGASRENVPETESRSCHFLSQDLSLETSEHPFHHIYWLKKSQSFQRRGHRSHHSMGKVCSLESTTHLFTMGRRKRNVRWQKALSVACGVWEPKRGKENHPYVYCLTIQVPSVCKGRPG